MQEGLPQFISSGFTILFAAITMLVLSPTLFAVVVVSLAVSMIATGYVSTLAQRGLRGKPGVHGRADRQD